MRKACCVFALCGGLLASGAAGRATAQIAPRLTGEAVIARLMTAQQDLAARAASLHDDSLDAASKQLGSMADALRKSLGDKASQPADLMDDSRHVAVMRADAAVQRTRTYLDTAKDCPGSDAKAMASGLAANIDRLAKASGSSKATPVVSGVESMDHRPVFALHPGNTPIALALIGTDLADPQCPDPQVSAIDEKGKLLNVQPVVTGALPTRIELKLPDGAGSESGVFVLRVVAKHKAFLRGCTAQPEALTALQVAPSLRVAVSYNLQAVCNGAHVPVGSGNLPDIVAYGTTSTQQVAAGGCADPSRYAIGAKVVFGDGTSSSVGPIEQSAVADITMGLPAGLTMSWSPSTRTVVVRSTANVCKGVY
ncbi:hypothetical protein [Dyella mobilis]|uniref:Uncharacterized protein n=1 Tax=Dyella mobilis TaxID=1849582 RepID=A0ABS2KD49_9GAMM|nr:hypothetical protein [Dyella mobilis]MBM7128869.1 hypothetical protein [Dyella mobilis]GLQ99200.1 hypothetical protein GCM10007863_36200 [Dyella mobilis]